jgi:1,4-alpha-glucan branching enzyme
MSLSKSYSDGKPVCKVTFKLSKELVGTAEKVNLVGDFNNWDVNGTLMKKLKGGQYSATVALNRDHEYQFKYLIDDKDWLNDNEADKYVPNGFSGENSVVVV